ncbi:MAG: secondary thiamine-phosphate synthase enzyme YjbQ [Desulfurococcales archaeon]|nr:secondary thiamine-phosphate synthase enzyme YjbQ [Desulfurococcales archaeon]MCE4605258.1 secondary thiamine-phosphate synthase enzyme YjbQ [Desulfurococcales archaeon]
MTRIESTHITIPTSSRFQLVDVTSMIQDWVSSINAGDGIVLVYSPHTTAGVIVNEAEPGLMKDILDLLREVTRPEGGWRHNRIDNNAHAHLAQVLVGDSRVIPVARGSLMLGTWQRVMLLEMDGPRRRRLNLVYIGS